MKMVTACFFSDGAVAEGEFHESMNLAALWQLPVLFCCENNLYAMGTALERHQEQTDITLKAQAYNIESAAVDGMNVRAVECATRQAVEQVRESSKPYLIEYRTYHFRAHSMCDTELYRNKDEGAEWKKRCPLATYETYLRGRNEVTDADFATIEAAVAAEINAAVAFAEAGAWEPVADLLKDVYT